jgi:DNA polymerase III alpha subunit (gram-positive type)
MIIGLFILISCSEMDNYSFDKMESQQSVILPSMAPDQWLLAHIDVETTGLLPGYHEMIDIGIAMTDLEGNIIDTLFLRIMPNHPERLSPKAFEVNAFNVNRWKKLRALKPNDAVDSIISFHHRSANDKNVLMIANNCHFDLSFIDHLFRSANKTWRELYFYYVLDIPSIAWGLGLRGLNNDEIIRYYNIADEPHTAEQHTGITGAMLNVRLYKALLRYRKEHLKPVYNK